jgi:phage head maturation protease
MPQLKRKYENLPLTPSTNQAPCRSKIEQIGLRSAINQRPDTADYATLPSLTAGDGNGNSRSFREGTTAQDDRDVNDAIFRASAVSQWSAD